MNLEAFSPIASETPPATGGLVFDVDGLPVPTLQQACLDRWNKLPRRTRETMSAAYLRELDAAANKKAKARRAYAPRFSTPYAIAYGRRQGWRLIDREGYDHRLRRSHDLLLGTDALFEGPNGMVGIQGAGLSERAEHYQRFEQRGGVDRARRLHVAILYLEFVRGDDEPRKLEWWVEHPNLLEGLP